MDAVRKDISGYNVEEFGCGFARFKDGLTIDIVESWAAHLDGFGGSAIMGSEAGLKLDPLSFHKTQHDLQSDSTFDLNAVQYRESTVHAAQYKHCESSQMHWISALRDEVVLLDTADIALNTALVQEGIFLSGKMGREVTVEEIKSFSVSQAHDIPNLI